MFFSPHPSPPACSLAGLALLIALTLSPIAVPTARAAPVPLFTSDGFAVPQPGHRFEFPRDHGAHLDFRLEWWYLTGHLFAADGRRFGYQATFFRSAGPDRTTQLYLAHMALLDVRSGRFLHQERLNRAGWDADSSTTTLDVRNGPWSLRFADTTTSDASGTASGTPRPSSETMVVHGGIQAEAQFTLNLIPLQPLVIFGEDGVSRKGAEPTAASYYLTFPRLRTTGTLKLGAESIPVTGESWMDHEISSSQLGSEQVGWDWAGIQLSDGRSLMFYRLRLRDGTSDPASTLTWVERDGRTRRAPFTCTVLREWTSPGTGARYPISLHLETTDPADARPVRLTLAPLADAQELSGNVGGIPYWEGACRVLDENGQELGSAFLELTGYARALKL